VVRKGKRRTVKQGGAARPGARADLLPVASLSRRLSRPTSVVSAGERNYYLDLADIALGQDADRNLKGKGKQRP
jgi:hypothetical protein